VKGGGNDEQGLRYREMGYTTGGKEVSLNFGEVKKNAQWGWTLIGN